MTLWDSFHVAESKQAACADDDETQQQLIDDPLSKIQLVMSHCTR